LSFRDVGAVDEFPDGEGREVRIGARRIAVYRCGQEFFAVKNFCPHLGDDLDRSPPRDGVLTCPAHGWQFDVRSGRCLRGEPGSRLTVYRARAAGGRVEIDVGRARG